MRWFTFILVLLTAVVLDTGNLLSLLEIGGWQIRPSILVTLLVYYAIACKANEAITCSFLIGIAADLATGSMGPHMLCYGLFGTVLNSAAGTLTTHRGILQAVFVFFAALVTGIGAYWLSLLKIRQPLPDVYSITLLTAFYSAILAPLVWSILELTAEWSGIAKDTSKRAY
ncbi:MAG: rod shape-determining protein MreD [Planctomycetota bacterium]|jgi:rod shape-determining protein MreD